MPTNYKLEKKTNENNISQNSSENIHSHLNNLLNHKKKAFAYLSEFLTVPSRGKVGSARGFDTELKSTIFALNNQGSSLAHMYFPFLNCNHRFIAGIFQYFILLASGADGDGPRRNSFIVQIYLSSNWITNNRLFN